jgi:enterochelin esterase-like enzyme
MQDRVFSGSHKWKVSRVEAIKCWMLLSLCLFIAFAFNPFVLAQEPFYKDQTIRIVVGFSAGGRAQCIFSLTAVRHGT